MCKNSGVNHGILCAFQLEGQDSAFKPPLPFQPGSLAFFFCFLWRAAAMPGSPQEQQHFRAEVRSGIRAAPAAHRLRVPRSERCCCSLCRPLNTLVMFQWKRGQKVAGPWWHEGTVMAPLLDGRHQARGCVSSPRAGSWEGPYRKQRLLALDMYDSSEVPRVSLIFLSSQRAGIVREEA